MICFGGYYLIIVNWLFLVFVVLCFLYRMGGFEFLGFLDWCSLLVVYIKKNKKNKKTKQKNVTHTKKKANEEMLPEMLYGQEGLDSVARMAFKGEGMSLISTFFLFFSLASFFSRLEDGQA